jgi:Ca2+-binding RTX toxin-like protein
VLSTGGNTLADQLQYTGPTSVPTSRGADCFGSGTGGSGKPAKVPGTTALGLLGDARRTDKDLRPLSISDHFDFGLALCGVGGHVAKGSKSWYLKVNHTDPQLGGDSVKVARGDEVLWYLAPSYPYPDELQLLAPARAQEGVAFTVRVLRFDDAGKRSPVQGVKIQGADLPTGPDGRATVQLDRTTVLTARKGAAIPDVARVCVGASCPAGPAQTIGGSSRRDVIAGTPGPDRVLASGGADRVNVRGGGADTVDCGAGKDVVVLDASDHARRCETRRGSS